MLSSTLIERPIFRRQKRLRSSDVLAGIGCVALISGLGWMLLKAIV